MIRIFLCLFIAFAMGLIMTNSFEQEEISKNYSAMKESPKNIRYHFERMIRDGLKNPYKEKIKSGLNNVSEFRTVITSVNSDTIENQKNPYRLFNELYISHHIMIMKKGNHYPSLFV